MKTYTLWKAEQLEIITYKLETVFDNIVQLITVDNSYNTSKFVFPNC